MANKRSSVEAVKKHILENIDLKIGQLIYIELKADRNGAFSSKPEITTFGRHFLYRWPYTSSVHTQNGKVRAVLSPLPEEIQTDGATGAPPKLSGARLLFGYASNEKDLNIGKAGFRRLAGRIAPNHAISVGTPQFLGSENTGYCVPLPVLGTPKASSWEHYVRQDQNKGTPQSYGDIPGDAGGELAGRKHYVHQTDDAATENIKRGEAEEKPELATLARYIAKSGTEFRFAVRFSSLRPWELGALLVALDPGRVEAGSYGHKLGAGRPIGMGSIALKVVETRLRPEGEHALRQEAGKEAAAIKAFTDLMPALPQAWLDLLRLPNGNTKVGYPSLKEHADQKKHYAKERRQADTDWAQTDAFIARLSN